ncbi:MAG: hypothetical protein EA428_04220 [Spirochaetaceae bacterium]|nr:MAG: hypothetical protein EA428_04220 [Spirochaetaceae bacterium]
MKVYGSAAANERTDDILLVTEQRTNRIMALDVGLEWSDSKACLWSWAPEEDKAVPQIHKPWFALLNEVKPIAESSKLLVTASGGAVAIVDIERAAATWYTYVGGNPHSAAMTNDGTVLCVASDGNMLGAFRSEESATGPAQVLRLSDAHGVCFEPRSCQVIALGGQKAIVLSWDDGASGGSWLTVQREVLLPCSSGSSKRVYPGGHDLAPSGRLPGRYYVSDLDFLWLLDVEGARFEPFPVHGRTSDIKSISERVSDARTVVVRAAEQWWSDTVEEIPGPRRWKLPDSRIYKARWLNGDH